jgi:arylsulfatase A-like enzyme
MTPPNILLITLDQWRADCLSAAGHPNVRTPNIDRLIGSGVWFRKHVTQSAPCGPARASLLTGLYQFNHRVLRNGTPLDARHRTLAQLFRAGGWRPTLFGYTDTAPDPRGLSPADPALTSYEGVLPGFDVARQTDSVEALWLDDLRARGYQVPATAEEFWRPANPTVNLRGPSNAPAPYPANHSETAFLARAAGQFLTGQRQQPWLCHVSFLRPHPPLIAPEPFNALVDPKDTPFPQRAATREAEGALHPWLRYQLHANGLSNPMTMDPWLLRDLTDAGVRQLRATYYGLIAEADAAIGWLLDALTTANLSENTIIVLTSDHGEQLGEHWLWGKDGFFDATMRIPLIICDPRSSADASRGRRVDHFTEAVDILPTLLELTNQPVPPACDGRSLKPFLSGESPADWRDAIVYEYDFRDIRTAKPEKALGLSSDQCGLTVLRDDQFKYVHFSGLPPLLFDLAADPGETTNLATDPSYAATLARYAGKLLSHRMIHADRTLTHINLGIGGAVSNYRRD